MFGLFEAAVNSTLNIAEDVLDGEVPAKRDVAKVVDTAATVYIGAELVNAATDFLDGWED